MVGNRPMTDWIAQYAESHRHPVNRLLHTVGIPLVALSVLAGLVTLVHRPFWPVFVTLFVVGWVIQFVGHAYEGRKPEFLTDWRFLFVGLRWWFLKLQGKA